MRLLHTSDWHIGVAHHGLDRTADHDKVFAQIKALAIEEKVDVILNTGDLFDNAYPSVETLKYGWSVLEEMASVAPIVVVCGNHDSEKLFQLMGMILKNRLPIYLVDRSTLQQREAGVLHLPTVDNEILKIAAVPFVKSSSYIASYIQENPDRATATYADKVGSLEHLVGEWLNANYDPNHDVRVFAAHLLVDGAEVSGSEYQLYVENDFVTRPDRIPSADYVAFGHIHKPQQIGKLEYGRYAGSPIPIDFGERGDKKVVYVVSGKPGRPVRVEERTLDIGRRLVDISGTLEEIEARRKEYAGAFARVVVDLKEPVAQLESRVGEILSKTHICKVTARYPRPEGAVVVAGELGRPEPTINELFETYAREHPNLGELERVVRYFNELYGQVRHGDEAEDVFADLDEVQQ
jgi:exonuclease SbcD